MIGFLIFVFVAVYIVGIIGWLCLIYFTEKEDIETIGDLLDKSVGFMYIPVFNIVSLMVIFVIEACVWLATPLKIDKLWEKFRNIKIK
jgi:TRAP-type C4-dicarboxylate transport system permease small subunit